MSRTGGAIMNGRVQYRHRVKRPIHADRPGDAVVSFTNAFITTEELADLLHVDPSTIRRWRTAEPVQGPPFIPLSDRVTVYSAADIQAWIMANRVVPGVRK